MLLTAFATLFSCYSAPTTASFFAISIFIIGHLADDIWLYGSQADSESIQQMARTLYWVLPNFEIFNLREAAVHGHAVPWQRVGMAVVYGLSYTALVLTAAIGIFQRKDIKDSLVDLAARHQSCSDDVEQAVLSVLRSGIGLVARWLPNSKHRWRCS